MQLGRVPYGEAFELQRSLAGAVSRGAVPETVIFLEHPPVVTIGRRTEADLELHIPADADVEIAETDRGGKSTFHGPGQLVCYPILDLANHGKDVKRYVHDLEEALIRTLARHEELTLYGTLALSTLSGGTHANLTAVYSGGTDYAGSTSPAHSHQVDQASSAVALCTKSRVQTR